MEKNVQQYSRSTEGAGKGLQRISIPLATASTWEKTEHTQMLWRNRTVKTNA